jgi:hypothetical protein
MTLFKTGIPLGAYTGEYRHLFAAQPGNAPPAAGGQANFLRPDFGAAAGKEVPNVGTVVGLVVHKTTIAPVQAGKGGRACPPINAAFFAGREPGGME